jgi:hypothetical protein
VIVCDGDKRTHCPLELQRALCNQQYSLHVHTGRCAKRSNSCGNISADRKFTALLNSIKLTVKIIAEFIISGGGGPKCERVTQGYGSPQLRVCNKKGGVTGLARIH